MNVLPRDGLHEHLYFPTESTLPHFQINAQGFSLGKWLRPEGLPASMLLESENNIRQAIFHKDSPRIGVKGYQKDSYEEKA